MRRQGGVAGCIFLVGILAWLIILCVIFFYLEAVRVGAAIESPCILLHAKTYCQYLPILLTP